MYDNKIKNKNDIITTNDFKSLMSTDVTPDPNGEQCNNL